MFVLNDFPHTQKENTDKRLKEYSLFFVLWEILDEWMTE